MKFAIRADATPELGSGHVMRCLTLANALRARKHTVQFVASRLPAYLCETVTAQGHDVVTPARTDEWTIPTQEWAGDAQERDAAAFLEAAPDAGWAICDHYGLGVTWERRLREAGRQVLAIDDLGRAHDCDVLLDQNYYADPAARYAGNAAAEMLLGPRYALLRPEFAEARKDVQPRRGAVRRILVCMGGADAGNRTSVAMDAIEMSGPVDIAVDIVIGKEHPARAAIAARCEARPHWQLHVQTGRMGTLLAAADLAIGAGGSATWERCALGVPTLALELAENQRVILQEGARAGFLMAVDGAIDAAHLASDLRTLARDEEQRRRMSDVAMGITDGLGASRVAAFLETA